MMGAKSSVSIHARTPADKPARMTKLLSTSAPMMMVKIIAVVCAASNRASRKIGHVIRRRPTAKARAPMAPMPPASLGVKNPNEMPPRIIRNSASTAHTR